jgi:hypothetical protein
MFETAFCQKCKMHKQTLIPDSGVPSLGTNPVLCRPHLGVNPLAGTGGSVTLKH